MTIRTIFILLLFLAQVIALYPQATARERIEQRRQRENNQQATITASPDAVQNNQEEEIIANARWSRIIYRYLDLSREVNAPLYYQETATAGKMNLFSQIFRLLEKGSVTAYEYLDGREEFTEAYKINLQEFMDRFDIYHETVNGSIVVNDADIPSREVQGYFMKELYYVDTPTSAFCVTPLAICPVLHRMDTPDATTTRYPLFWIPYSALEPYTRRMPVMASSLNNSLYGTIDDFFRQRKYEGEIYKTGNPRNLSISQYTSTPEEMKAEQKRIEKELTDFERYLDKEKKGTINARLETQLRSGNRSSKSTPNVQGSTQTMRDRRY
ncbi:MAG: gliding motility protein GldN [Porphyromonadaceae bacterium]|nr:gliding motility protein GldN [Porphyromonadaceae bacterium]